jgi:hypothetical protein
MVHLRIITNFQSTCFLRLRTNSHQDGCLLGCCAMYSGRISPMFQRCVLPPSSGRWWITLMMEVASTSEMSVNFYQTTWHNNPEDSHLHTRCHENLKSHLTHIKLRRQRWILIYITGVLKSSGIVSVLMLQLLSPYFIEWTIGMREIKPDYCNVMQISPLSAAYWSGWCTMFVWRLSELSKSAGFVCIVKCRFNERRSNEIFSKTKFFSGPHNLLYIFM